MHVSAITPVSLTAEESGLVSKHEAIVDTGTGDLYISVAMSSRDELLVSGTTLLPFDDQLSSDDDRKSLWSIAFAAKPDAQRFGINPMPLAVDTGLRRYDEEHGPLVAGRLTAMALFVAGAYSKKMSHQPAASMAPNGPATAAKTPSKFGSKLKVPTETPPRKASVPKLKAAAQAILRGKVTEAKARAGKAKKAAKGKTSVSRAKASPKTLKKAGTKKAKAS